MKITNNAIFCRIWQKVKDYGLSFISSNGGTGKTVFFKMKLLRDAVEHNMPFHIFVRFKNQMEQCANAFLDDKPTYSNRQRALLARCAVRVENDNFIYIVDAEDVKKIYAQVLNIHGQAFYKQFGNTIGAKRAFFDEVLAEDGAYVPNELNKFNRLIHTMARSNEYHVYCLYNNTSPNFDYFKYYGGKSYQTHVAESGALFIYFTARQYSADNGGKHDAKSIQSIMSHTQYKDVYERNMFAQFPTFCKPRDLRGTRVLCRLEIENRVFKIRLCPDGYIYVDERRGYKKSKKPLYTVNVPERTSLKKLPAGLWATLVLARNAARLKTANVYDSIFVKILSERLH